MTFTHALATNRYGEADLIVSTSAANGTHTTLASAMAAATSGQTIFLRDSVTENVTITPGVNIAALGGTSLNVPSITGTLTMTAAGTSTISGLRLVTNSSFVIAITGSAASILNVNNCYFNCSNNTGISFTSSSASSRLSMSYCNGDLGTTGIAILSASTAGTLFAQYCTFLNTGNSTTNNTCASTGNYTFNYCDFNGPFTTSNTASFSSNYMSVVCAALNVTAFTHNSTLGTGALRHSQLLSGTAIALNVGAGALLELINFEVDSSNATTITNAGTVQYALIQSGSTTAITLGGAGTYTQLPVSPSITSVVVQQIRASTTTAGSTTTILPFDNTIPQNTEGAQVLTVTITPTNSSHILVIDYQLWGSTNAALAGEPLVAALFQDSTAGALQATLAAHDPFGTLNDNGCFGRYYMTAGTTSATTFKLRLGPGAAGTGYWMGNNGSAIFSTVNFMSLIVTQYTT